MTRLRIVLVQELKIYPLIHEVVVLDEDIVLNHYIL